ncbi:optineurin-like [Anopheles nili]|uniref:optineurin-like n=1 Tax=Anopheles nili TaxID=185578 RepID=UPI00237AD481|nr:optineurin-like [Anopheles nili]
MEELKDILREYVKRNQMLETLNEKLQETLMEQEKMRKIYIDDLNNMKMALGNLQDLLMKCRANILCHEIMNKPTISTDAVDNELKVCNDETRESVSLQAQLEVCKTDLSEQRAAYQELLVEKNRITGELQTLLQKNHQLSMQQVQNRGDPSKVQSTHAKHTEAIKLFGTSPGVFERQIDPCPHCNNVFGDFLTLEMHIKDCPGLDY